MSDLRITPTRWNLLLQIDDGAVTRNCTDDGFVDELYLSANYWRRVNAAVGQLDRANLVILPGLSVVETGWWELTVEGKRLLSEHTCSVCRGYTAKGPTCGPCRGRADD